MSLQVGQHIRDFAIDYTTPFIKINLKDETQSDVTGFGDALRDNYDYPEYALYDGTGRFQDFCLQMQNTTFKEDEYYYVKVVFEKLPIKTVFNVVLRNSDDQTENRPLMMTVSKDNVLEAGGGAEVPYQVFEYCFQPNTSYDQLVFEMQRQAYDYMYQQTIDAGTVIFGRVLKLYQDATRLKLDQVVAVEKIKNIKDILHLTDKTLVKIGVQANPTFLFCINGEPIRVGTVGFYEMNNSLINLSFVGFVLPAVVMDETHNAGIETLESKFILDYEYE